MKKTLFLLAFVIAAPFLAQAQFDAEPADTSWKKIFRGSHPKVNDLVHTKLEAKFDYNKSYLNGKVWITLKPHFYNTDSLTLDAKGMDIKEVAIVKGATKSKLKYTYDDAELRISLARTYKNNEN